MKTVSDDPELNRRLEQARQENQNTPVAEPDKILDIRRAKFDGREFERQADGKWLDEWGYQLDMQEGKLTVIRPLNQWGPMWETNSLARWEGKPIPDREWFMEGWIPRAEVVGLYGKPGARKSTLLLQLMIASVLGKGFGSCPKLLKGPCYGLFCEDDQFEIARRAKAILDRYQATFADVQDCHPESLTNAKLTEFVTFRRGIMISSPAWEQFVEEIKRFKPVFSCLDVAPDFFGGNEIDRSQVHQFLQLLHRTAAQFNTTIVFSHHPSLRGIADKTMSSGSTGWEGKPRARIVISDPEQDDDDEAPTDSDRRLIELVKANYAKAGQQMRFVLRNGVFIPEDIDPQAQAKRSPADNAAAERAFLDRLKTRIEEGRYVSNAKATAVYAPAILAGNGFPMRTLESAMNRLFDQKILRWDGKQRGNDRWLITKPKTRSPDDE